GEQISVKNLALVKAEMTKDELKLAVQLAKEWMEYYP
ncbi:MAG: hypothetical protein ACI9N9_002530, partial [Enterobacterales bacterium]